MAFGFRRERQCGVCKWTGPRRAIRRWGDGFVCWDEQACIQRHQASKQANGFPFRRGRQYEFGQVEPSRITPAEYLAWVDRRTSEITDELTDKYRDILRDGFHFEWLPVASEQPPPARPFLAKASDDFVAWSMNTDVVAAFWQDILKPPAINGGTLPYTHTFTPGEPPRRRWWQFWRRQHAVWPTHTLTEDKRQRWRESTREFLGVCGLMAAIVTRNTKRIWF